MYSKLYNPSYQDIPIVSGIDLSTAVKTHKKSLVTRLLRQLEHPTLLKG